MQDGERVGAWAAMIDAPRDRLPRASVRYDHVLLDLDGCLWVGDEALPTAPRRPSRRCARRASRSLFLTNDVRHAPEEFVRKLWRLGFQAVAGRGA